MKELIMEKKKGLILADFSKLICVLPAIFLCVAPVVWAYTEFTSGPYTVDYTISGTVWVFPEASVTLEGAAHIADNVTPGEEENGDMYVIGIVDFLAGVVDGIIHVSPDATITVYGTGFEDSSGPISATEWTPAGGSDILTGTYENGTPINLLFNSDTAITLVDTGGGGPIEVTIDIKPGSTPNAINLGSNGVIPVAILSDADFVATDLDPDTVFLAGSGVAVRGKGSKYLASEEDVNGDSLLDLVVKVETENLDPGTFQDGRAILQVIVDNIVIYQGSDEITIVPPE
jgi:hypothetical protein